MPPSRTLRQAEKKALDGANESQDTLLVAHHLMMDFGVGLRSSSPAGGEETPAPSSKKNDSTGLTSAMDGENVSLLTKPGQRPIDANATPASASDMDRADRPTQTRGTRSAYDSQTHHSILETQDVGLQEEPRPVLVPDWNNANDNGVVSSLNLPDSLPPSAEVNGTLRRKMDSSQDSTQSNVGRSYDQYRRPSAAGCESPKPQRSCLPDPTTDNKDVADDRPKNDLNSDAVHTHINTISPAQDDSGFVDFGKLAHLRNAATDQTVQSPFPETPTPPQNPFRNSRSQLLPTSQLFRGTQYSSAVKMISPTSSRPSPADFPRNDISPHPVSSPLKARGLRSTPPVEVTSSPEVLPGTTSPDIRGQVSSPTKSSSANAVIPESSRECLVRKRSNPDPMSTYEPMSKSQERRATSEMPRDAPSSAEEDDEYDAITRRQKVKAKKEAALKQLNAISFQRPSKPDDVEVPSTSQRKRTSQAEAYIAQCYGRDPTAKDSDTSKASDTPGRDKKASRSRKPAMTTVIDDESTQSEAEEETIPTRNEPFAPAPFVPPARDGDAVPETSPTYEDSSALPQTAPSSKPNSTAEEQESTFQSSPPAFSTRARRGTARKGLPRVPESTSTLSNLASTPRLPSEKPPSTEETASTASPSEATVVGSSSPASVKTTRRDARGRLPKLKTSTERLKQSAQVTRRVSDSTDEITRSASSTPTFEQSMRSSRLSTTRSASRSGRWVTKSPAGNSKLFENMAFAISFQSKKPGESETQFNVRMEFSETIEKRIKQAGGRILQDGFDELFELPSPRSTTPSSSPDSESEIRLTSEGLSMGFTALIADGHSRKAKYMQALALGLPCIAPRWVTTCLDRKEIVDWTPYLLCAGQSSFLGDAIRSRTLPAYDAETARLADVVAQREQMLQGSRILAVVKKSAESRKMAYVFLARVLGGSLTRVYSADEGREELKKAEEKGRPFDWVYVDGPKEEEALFGTGQQTVGVGRGRKRKRASTGPASSMVNSANTSAASLASLAPPPGKRARTLTDELVIQSLILGRMIEEGEMDG